MATQVVMPKLSPTMEEGQLSRWLKQEGEKVSVGEPLAEIDTDKATMEAQALATGVLRKILVEAGSTVPLGQVIAIIGEPDEDISALVSQAGSGQAAAENKQSIKSVEGGQTGAQQELAQVVPGGERTQSTIEGAPLKGDVGGQAGTSDQQAQPDDGAATQAAQQPPQQPPPPRPTAAPTPEPDSSGNGQRGDGRMIVSPLAARMASEAGLNLQSLTGSGPGGRIVKRDIEAAISERGKQPPPQQQAPPAEAPAQPGAAAAPIPHVARPAQQPAIEGASPYRDEPLSTMRSTIARRLTSSIGPVPHFFLTTEIEMDRTADLRRSLNELDKETKISFNDIIIKVAAVALAQHRQVNASFQDKAVRYYERADIGVAVAIEDGLITPVIRSAERKSIGQISREVRELAERARARKLQPEEYTGATFSISNLGMFGIDDFTAVINPPEAAILAVGAVQPKAVVRDNEIVARQMMRVTMSCDHRVIDGATGAQFLQTFKQILENPLLLMM
ncbi:MAG: pyruvate dehydrogenase complex dihydrolipoamide acetyltransferase [Acidobacteriota bacterium]|nr:pyruvate dehydrogenase complex dihydrolipoamide acetyltransferase [Acidobacteriota bacterium]